MKNVNNYTLNDFAKDVEKLNLELRKFPQDQKAQAELNRKVQDLALKIIHFDLEKTLTPQQVRKFMNSSQILSIQPLSPDQSYLFKDCKEIEGRQKEIQGSGGYWRIFRSSKTEKNVDLAIKTMQKTLQKITSIIQTPPEGKRKFPRPFFHS